MFNAPVLDLVILLSFTYFIGSLILSAVNEALASTLRLRQKDLRTGLLKFFLSAEWRAFVNNHFLKSPHIETLMKRKNRLPVYIPARNFVLAIVQHLDEKWYQKGKISSCTTTPEAGQPAGKDILPKHLCVVLETIMKQVSHLPAAELVPEFEKRVEEFYNNTMDRVTGWYKRRVRRILLVTGFVLSVLLNIDTIKIANDAMQDKAKLSKAVDNITTNLSRNDSMYETSLIIADSAGNVNIKRTKMKADSVILNYQQVTGYRLGYKDLDEFKQQWSGRNFWIKLFGVLLTAFALQLGSTYWFDIMNKAVNIRATGKKPDEKIVPKK